MKLGVKVGFRIDLREEQKLERPTRLILITHSRFIPQMWFLSRFLKQTKQQKRKEPLNKMYYLITSRNSHITKKTCYLFCRCFLPKKKHILSTAMGYLYCVSHVPLSHFAIVSSKCVVFMCFHSSSSTPKGNRYDINILHNLRRRYGCCCCFLRQRPVQKAFVCLFV